MLTSNGLIITIIMDNIKKFVSFVFEITDKNIWDGASQWEILTY